MNCLKLLSIHTERSLTKDIQLKIKFEDEYEKTGELIYDLNFGDTLNIMFGIKNGLKLFNLTNYS